MGVLGQPPFSLGSLPLPGLQAQMAASQAMAQVHGQQQQGGPTFQRDSGQPQGVKVCPGASVEYATSGTRPLQKGHHSSLWRWFHLLLL